MRRDDELATPASELENKGHETHPTEPQGIATTPPAKQRQEDPVEEMQLEMQKVTRKAICSQREQAALNPVILPS